MGLHNTIPKWTSVVANSWRVKWVEIRKCANNHQCSMQCSRYGCGRFRNLYILRPFSRNLWCKLNIRSNIRKYWWKSFNFIAFGTIRRQGDSGGPLVTLNDDGKAILTGLVTYGTNLCATGKPDAYTRVGYFRPWIIEKITIQNWWAIFFTQPLGHVASPGLPIKSDLFVRSYANNMLFPSNVLL